jgi:hypothetical protein
MCRLKWWGLECVSWEEEEKEFLRAVGTGTRRTAWKLMFCLNVFPLPPDPTVLIRCSFLFLRPAKFQWRKQYMLMCSFSWWGFESVSGKRKKWVSKSSGHGNMEESLDLSFPLQLGVEVTWVISQCLPCLLFLVTHSSSFWLTQLFRKIKTEDMHTQLLDSEVMNTSREDEETVNLRAHWSYEHGRTTLIFSLFRIIISLELGGQDWFQCFSNASHA